MSTELRRVGWIGTGVMGASMARHVLDAGHTLVVHTRTPARAAPLLEAGATWADTPASAADGADVVVSIVGYPDDVRATHLGPSGTLAADRLPRFLVDMTTSRPSLAAEIQAAARAKGVGAIDAPVSGGDVGARNATLSIMVGGDEADVDAVRPLLARLGGNVVRQGGPGAGQHTKMVNQILIASGMMGVCEGLLYAAAAGLDPSTVIASVGAGAAGSWSINHLGPRMIGRDFEPGFSVEHFLKDLGIALDEAARLGLALPGLALARQFYEAVRAQGHGRKGTQALLLALERLNGIG
ncbi:MAG: NAD(P)-dependent oxidoreductase [Phycisphaerales bacterium]|nr:NAD(P)-dependent oxidoreductase [Phycisphaerales bacterium]